MTKHALGKSAAGLNQAGGVANTIAAERSRVLAIIEKWRRADHMRMHAGEMTAQEVRTVRAIGGLIKAVEPYPIPNLSIEEIENDNRILNENRKRFDQEREAYIKRKEGQESHCPKI